MRTLILSCNNGGGHNAVAAAIRELYNAHSETAEIIDAMSFLPSGWSRLASDFHSYVYRRHPEAFRRGYHHAETHRKQFARWHSTRNILALGKAKLGKYIRDHHYDRVICCHVFAALMLTDAIKKYHLEITSCVIETDYTLTPGAEMGNLDWHFVPSAALKAELVAFGVPEEKIAVSGIPTRRQFEKSRSKAEARAAFGLEAEKKNILLACGSMGGGPMEAILKRLAARREEGSDFTVSVLCGTNKRLRRRLNRLYRNQANIHVFGRIQDMSTLMDAADVYVTKPGGISVTEAAQKRLPMVLINAVGGCEQYNLDTFVLGGGAVSGHSPEEIAEQAVRVCGDDGLSREMGLALERIFSENNKEIIYRCMKPCKRTDA